MKFRFWLSSIVEIGWTHFYRARRDRIRHICRRNFDPDSPISWYQTTSGLGSHITISGIDRSISRLPTASSSSPCSKTIDLLSEFHCCLSLSFFLTYFRFWRSYWHFRLSVVLVISIPCTEKRVQFCFFHGSTTLYGFRRLRVRRTGLRLMPLTFRSYLSVTVSKIISISSHILCPVVGQRRIYLGGLLLSLPWSKT